MHRGLAMLKPDPGARPVGHLSEAFLAALLERQAHDDGETAELRYHLRSLLGSAVRREEDLRRRTFLWLSAALAGGWALPASAGPESWERLGHALRYPGRLDQTAVDDLERVTVILEQLEPQISPRALLSQVDGHMRTLSALLKASLSPWLRRRLCSIAGETAGLAGWLMWDLDNTAVAAALFRHGLDAAHEAQDRALGAYLVGCASIQPAYRENPEARLAALQGSTYGFAQADASLMAQAWLAAKEAEAYALLGKEDDCLRVLDRVGCLHAKAEARDSEPRPRAGYPAFPATFNVSAEQGSCLSTLGRAEPAEAFLRRALSSLSPSSAKARYWLLPSLATVHVQQGNIEEACRIAADALEGSTGLENAVNQKMGLAVRRELEPHGHARPVMELDERIRALGL